MECKKRSVYLLLTFFDAFCILPIYTKAYKSTNVKNENSVGNLLLNFIIKKLFGKQLVENYIIHS